MKLYQAIYYSEMSKHTYYELEKHFLAEVKEILEKCGTFVDVHVFVNKHLLVVVESGIFRQTIADYVISDKPLIYKFIDKKLCVIDELENKVIKIIKI